MHDIVIKYHGNVIVMTLSKEKLCGKLALLRHCAGVVEDATHEAPPCAIGSGEIRLIALC